MIIDIIWAIGLVLMIEGLVYLLAPQLFVNLVKQLSNLPLSALRMTGACVALIGALIIWALQHWA